MTQATVENSREGKENLSHKSVIRMLPTNSSDGNKNNSFLFMPVANLLL